jgi:hypothetical protein
VGRKGLVEDGGRQVKERVGRKGWGVWMETGGSEGWLEGLGMGGGEGGRWKRWLGGRV